MNIKVYSATLKEGTSKAGNLYKYIEIDFGLFKKKLFLDNSLIDVLENLAKNDTK